MHTDLCCSFSKASVAPSPNSTSQTAVKEVKSGYCTASTVLKIFAVVGAIIFALGALAMLSIMYPQAGALAQIFSPISQATGVVAASMGMNALALASLGAFTGFALILGSGLSTCSVSKEVPPHNRISGSASNTTSFTPTKSVNQPQNEEQWSDEKKDQVQKEIQLSHISRLKNRLQELSNKPCPTEEDKKQIHELENDLKGLEQQLQS